MTKLDDPQSGYSMDLTPRLGVGEGRPYSSLESLFMYRLARLLSCRQEYERAVGKSQDWRLRLLHKAIYSTYCDCVALGIGGDAQHLVFAHQQPT